MIKIRVALGIQKLFPGWVGGVGLVGFSLRLSKIKDWFKPINTLVSAI